MLRWSVDNRFYGLGYDVIGVFSVVLVAGAYRTGSLLGRVLGHPLMCWIGIRAYSLYLVHYPLFLLMTRDRVPLPPPALMTLRLVTAFVVADLAYRHVEQPFQRMRGRFTARPASSAARAPAPPAE
jgi:peptidoglycan/LPS O-acetylase OafA/YrhL